jgi:hypothetical protein
VPLEGLDQLKNPMRTCEIRIKHENSFSNSLFKSQAGRCQVDSQRLGKHVHAAMNTQAAMKELLDASFSVRSVSYQRKVGDYFFLESVVKLCKRETISTLGTETYKLAWADHDIRNQFTGFHCSAPFVDTLLAYVPPFEKKYIK